MTRIQTTLRLLWLVAMLLAPAAGAVSRGSGEQMDLTLAGALRETPDEARGARLYEAHCQSCHQVGAVGSQVTQAPALAGQHYEYLVKQLVDFLDQNRTHEVMRRQLLTRGFSRAAAIADVAGYLANLPAAASVEHGNGEASAEGERLFASSCAACHGSQAIGRGDLWVPDLRHQHYSYLLRQMRQMARRQRGNVSDDLHRALAVYTDAELAAMADWLSRRPTVPSGHVGH